MARGIYKIINGVNNKFYVGSAVNFEKRKARHVWRLRRGDHANKHLQAAWNKYGEKVFIFILVEEVSETEDLLAAENIWLREHVGKDYCYNLGTDATAPTRGWVREKNPMWGKTFTHTNVAKAKIAAASTGRKQDPDVIRRKTQHLLGKQKPANVRAKISATLSGEGNYWYGKKRPEFAVKVSKPIRATKPDGSVLTYASIVALRQDLGLKPPTVNRALKSGKPLVRGPFKGWVFKYIDTPQIT